LPEKLQSKSHSPASIPKWNVTTVFAARIERETGVGVFANLSGHGKPKRPLAQRAGHALKSERSGALKINDQ
jgi:hypothetical protein